MKTIFAIIAALLLVGTGSQSRAALADPALLDLQGNIALVNQGGGSLTKTGQRLDIAPSAADIGQLIRQELSATAQSPASGTLSVRGHVVDKIPASGRLLSGQIRMLSSAPLSLAALAGVAKPSQGFFLDNPDDPGAGVTLSFTTSAPLPVIVMDTTPSPTPLPPAFLLFGSGLAGLAATKLRTRLS